MSDAMRRDVYTLDEGDMTVQSPAHLSRESFAEVKDWFALLLRKFERAAEDSKPSSDCDSNAQASVTASADSIPISQGHP